MYFPSNFSVCGADLVRNSVDELFVEIISHHSLHLIVFDYYLPFSTSCSILSQYLRRARCDSV